MGKSPKGFWAHTSQMSEKKIKVILKYVTSKKNSQWKEEQSVRMSNLNDSFLSFKKGETHNSTNNDVSFISRTQELDDSLNEAANEYILVNSNPKKTSKRKQITVKISVEELDNSSDNSDRPLKVVFDDSLVQTNFNRSVVSHDISQDSLEDISGVQLLSKSTVNTQNLTTEKVTYDPKNKIKNRRNYASALKEYDDFKHRALLPTDANYYTPQTKSKTNDEKIADIIREIVLKKFEQRRKQNPKKRKGLVGGENADLLDSNVTEESYYTNNVTTNKSDLSKSNVETHIKTCNATQGGDLPQSDCKNLTTNFAQESKISATFEVAEEFFQKEISYEEPTNVNLNEKSELQRKDMNFSPSYYASILSSFNNMAATFPSQKANNMANIENMLSNEMECNQEKFKQKTQNFITPKWEPKQENQSCYFSCEPERKEIVVKETPCTGSDLNGTFTQATPYFHTTDGQAKLPKKNLLKLSASSASYYTTEELANISSCSSQGVYDCFKSSVLPKEEVSPYFEKMKKMTNNNTSGGRSVSYEEVQYDEHKFLQDALGSEFEMTCSDVSLSTKKPPVKPEPIYDRSIDTDNISTLISSESCAPQKLNSRRLKRKINSVNTFTSVLTETSYEDLVYEAKYIPVSAQNNVDSQHDSGMSSGAGTRKLTRKSLPSVARNNRDIFVQPKKPYPLYEDIQMADTSNDDVNKTKDAHDDLMQKIAQQAQMIKQAERVLEYGKKQRHFYGSAAHLEAEKIRLVSTIRRNVFEKELINKSCRIKAADETVLAKVVIKNAVCTSSVPYTKKSRKKQYFIGIFQNDATVLCTTYAQPNMFGDVEFEGQFTFEELKSNFEIKFSLYTIAIEKRDVETKFGCFQRPLNKKYSEKYLKLVGTHKFEKSTIGAKKAIKLENYRDYSASYKFSAISDLFIKPGEPLKGVLTIGSEIRGHPVWNSRWCVLEGADLKCYQFPSDEFYGKPFSSMNLRNCQSCKLDHTVGNVFKLPGLKLTFIVNNIETNRYLVADDVNQLYHWQKHILVAMQTSKKW